MNRSIIRLYIECLCSHIGRKTEQYITFILTTVGKSIAFESFVG
jgi:hypothetical protein